MQARQKLLTHIFNGVLILVKELHSFREMEYGLLVAELGHFTMLHPASQSEIALVRTLSMKVPIGHQSCAMPFSLHDPTTRSTS